jgi:flagellar biosynthesis/type III secretory pathway protein FliH
MAELQAEADRRAAELRVNPGLLAEQQRIVKEETDRRQAEEQSRLLAQERLKEEAEQQRLNKLNKAAEEANQQRLRDAQESSTPEGRMFAHLADITRATQSSADSLRQIRNAIVFLVILSAVVFILQLLMSGPR